MIANLETTNHIVDELSPSHIHSVVHVNAVTSLRHIEYLAKYTVDEYTVAYGNHL